ncbi:MAG: tetratricopeptide repeat protein [Planctomycetaceae bacterium]
MLLDSRRGSFLSLSVFLNSLLVAVACAWFAANCVAVEPEPEPQTTASDPRVGTKVLVTTAGAELKTPKAVVWRAYLGEVFTVSLVNGEWLWINEKQGWMWDRQTVPLATAIQETSTRLNESPTAENFHLRGVAWLAHDDYDKAIADFTQCLAKEPRNAGAFNNRGQAHYLKKDFQRAIADFSRALSIDAKHFLALNNRALAYIATEQFDPAVKDIEAALALNPEYPEALNNRGVVRQKQGNTQQAIADFSAALKIDPSYTDAYGNRAYAYRMSGKYADAIQDLKTAMQKNPLNFEPVNDLGWVLATAKDNSIRNPAEAVAMAKKACEMTQYENWNALDTLAAASAEAGDFKNAGQWITTAIEKAPEDRRAPLKAHQELILSGKPIRD